MKAAQALPATLMQRVRSVSKSAWAFPVVLLAIGLLSYSIQIFHLGFYWDDWQALFLAKVTGRRILWDYFAYDRPFSAWTYVITLPLFGLKPWIWQIATLSLRWIGVVSIYAVLRITWPERIWFAQWTGVLLMVYPGFSMQSISVAFNQHFITFACFGISLYSMVRAVRSTKSPGLWLGLSLMTAAVQVFTMEYFAGLELLRPIFLWLLIRRPGQKPGRTVYRTFIWWLPFLALLVGFVFWRLVWYPSHALTQIRNTPLMLLSLGSSTGKALLNLVSTAQADSTFLLFDVWMNAIRGSLQIPITRSAIVSIVLGGLAATTFIVWLRWRRVHNPADPGRAGFLIPAGLLGLAALLLGAMPVWLTERVITVGKWSDRFTLGPMLGVVILVVLFTGWMIRTEKQRNILLAILLAFSIATQVSTADRYRRDWDSQRDFFWQLKWRAPDLVPGTAILGQEIPGQTLSDYATGFALNVVYADNLAKTAAPYWFFTPRDFGTAIPSLESGSEIHTEVRNIYFDGNTSQLVAVVFHPSGGCLRVLDDPYHGDPILDQTANTWTALSNTGQILASAQREHLSVDIFGHEPERDWCYYFEKADLSRQLGDWNAVQAYMQTATGKGLKPSDGAEWAPLLDAMAHTGQWQPAYVLSQQAQKDFRGLQPFLCARWTSFEALAAGGSGNNTTRQALATFGCAAGS